ncbi:hypothetical protein [Treponema denticola]|uniref:hypothetical protein n=1 Tax=Treponema denticola TaxID=158 RepID=UPI0021020E14|nr:hypothetical protein [Treponema denticola]UTY27228.1 hypothetical protein E4N77_11680 [Treponema denticola]
MEEGSDTVGIFSGPNLSKIRREAPKHANIATNKYHTRGNDGAMSATNAYIFHSLAASIPALGYSWIMSLDQCIDNSNS